MIFLFRHESSLRTASNNIKGLSHIEDMHA